MDRARFNDIAPYSDQEVQEALRELVDQYSFIKVLRFVYPELTESDIQEKCADIRSVAQFQKEVSHPAMRLMIDQTIDSLTHNGLENLDDDGHLFISNHRDIILDSAILNVVLFENGHETTETAIGSNLLSDPTVRLLTKLNKNFTVARNLEGRDLYSASLLLSDYIRTKVTEDAVSIWISQREGRSKDGNDRTQAGLIKMIGMSEPEHTAQGFAELSIRPVCFSYEYDPCDTFKIRELLAKQTGEEYIKEEDEDLKSIVAGITGPKGRVHVEIGGPVDGQLALLTELTNKNEQYQAFTDIMDRAIHRGLHLFPNNYYAADLHTGSDTYADHYSSEDVEAFDEYMAGVVEPISGDRVEAERILVEKYAWPVFNLEAATSGIDLRE